MEEASFSCYKEAGAVIEQLISSIVFYLMGRYIIKRRIVLGQSDAVEKINEARAFMKRNIDNPMSVESIAQSLNVSYSWFRSTFKSYTEWGASRSISIAFTLSSSKRAIKYFSLSISEIAYALNFETVSQFSTFS